MTPNQEDRLYDFLENVTEPFTLEDVTAFVRTMDSVQMTDSGRTENLPAEIAAHIDSRNVAFRLENRY
jgi:hypothetical protein